MSIQFKRIINAGREPLATVLKEGELAINFPDQTVFTKDHTGKIISIGGGGGGASSFEVVAANTAAQNNSGYLVETSKGAYTITLPTAALKNGTSVSVGDYDGNAFNNPITISSGANKIMGQSESVTLDIDYATITLTYIESKKDWRIVNGAGESAPPSFVSADKVYTGVKDEFRFIAEDGLIAKSGQCDVYYNSGRLVENYGYKILSTGEIELSAVVTSDEDIITVRVYNRVELGVLDPIYERLNSISNPNLLINGDFSICQRGSTNGTAAAQVNRDHGIDRWYSIGNGQNMRSLRRSDFGNATPIIREGNYSSGQIYASGTSNSYRGMGQAIESVNSAQCAGKRVTVSGWAKFDNASASPLLLNVYMPNALDNYTSTTSIVGLFNLPISKSTTWVKFSHTFTCPSGVGYGLAMDLQMNNSPDNEILYLSELKLEIGNTATPFVADDQATNLTKCQRYYFQSSFYGANYDGGGETNYASCLNNSWQKTNNLLPVIMRARPMATFWCNAGLGKVYNWNTGATPGYGATLLTIDGTISRFAPGIGTASERIGFDFKADAEI